MNFEMNKKNETPACQFFRRHRHGNHCDSIGSRQLKKNCGRCKERGQWIVMPESSSITCSSDISETSTSICSPEVSSLTSTCSTELSEISTSICSSTDVPETTTVSSMDSSCGCGIPTCQFNYMYLYMNCGCGGPLVENYLPSLTTTTGSTKDQEGDDCKSSMTDS